MKRPGDSFQDCQIVSVENPLDIRKAFFREYLCMANY